LLLLALAASAVLSGCGRKDEQPLKVLMLPSDPGAASAIRQATSEGLVAVDAEARITPALADSWIVTEDGQSYIFRLRDGTWPDGSPLTGESARASLRQSLAALRASPLQAELDAIDEVRAMAGRVIEIRLRRPLPELLQLLARPELGLTRRGTGAGPMSLERDGARAILTPIPPERRGLPAVRNWSKLAHPLVLATSSAAEGVALFAAGKADVILGGTFNEWPAVFGSSLPGTAIQVDRAVGLFGLTVAHTDGFLAEAERREAIAMAIDRAALSEALREPGWVATSRIVTPGTEGDAGTVAERWEGLSMEQRRALAASRLARWRSRHGPVSLRIAMPAGAGADLVFARLAADLQTVGFAVQRVAASAPADLKLIDEVAAYDRASWFLNRLSCRARPSVCSPAADARFAAAQATADPAVRGRALSDAEAQLAGDNVYIPFGAPLRWSLAGPGVTGLSPNPLALHPLLPLAIRPAK
jgi:ABC-type transport system substrate-binding protein